MLYIKWKHFPRYWPFVRGSDRWIPRTKASDADLWCFPWSAPEQAIEQIIEWPVIRYAIVLIMTSLWCHNIYHHSIKAKMAAMLQVLNLSAFLWRPFKIQCLLSCNAACYRLRGFIFSGRLGWKRLGILQIPWFTEWCWTVINNKMHPVDYFLWFKTHIYCKLFLRIHLLRKTTKCVTQGIDKFLVTVW